MAPKCHLTSRNHFLSFEHCLLASKRAHNWRVSVNWQPHLLLQSINFYFGRFDIWLNRHTLLLMLSPSPAVEKCALNDFSRQSETLLLSKLLSWIFGGLPISALLPLAALTVSCLCKPPKLTLALTDLVNFLTIWLVETLSPKQSFIFLLQLVSCRQRLQ